MKTYLKSEHFKRSSPSGGTPDSGRRTTARPTTYWPGRQPCGSASMCSWVTGKMWRPSGRCGPMPPGLANGGCRPAIRWPWKPQTANSSWRRWGKHGNLYALWPANRLPSLLPPVFTIETLWRWGHIRDELHKAF